MYFSEVSGLCRWYTSVLLNDENVSDFARSNDNTPDQLHLDLESFVGWYIILPVAGGNYG